MCVCVPTGDLLSGLVGRVCVCVCMCLDRRPAFGSCREGVFVYVSHRRPAFGSCREGMCCVYVPTGDLLSGLVGRVCVCVCVPTGDLLSVFDIIYKKKLYIHFYNHE